MENYDFNDVGSDTESEPFKDEPTCPPTNSKIAALKRMEVSATDDLDDANTTITQSTGGSDTQVIPKSYFMTSKGLLRLNEESNNSQ